MLNPRLRPLLRLNVREIKAFPTRSSHPLERYHHRPTQIQTLHLATAPKRPKQCLQRQRLELLRNPRRNPRVAMQMRFIQYQQATKKGVFARTWQGYKKLFRENPLAMGVFTFFVVPVCVLLAIFTYVYYVVYIVGFFSPYPEAVAVELRKALWYTDRQLDPEKARKYYIRAQRVALEQEKMDPFSEEVIGIRIMYAALFEKMEKYPKAIQMYERIYEQNVAWLKKVGARKGWMGRRNLVLKNTIKVAIKLGDLYASPYVMERDLAEEKMIWAIETGLKEVTRRERDGVAEEEGPWLEPGETGAAMERLAHIWEERNLYHLAAPLFLQALMNCPKNSCHAAVLMNNLSISLAQQTPPSVPGETPQTTRATLLSNARQWAEKATNTADSITGGDRDEECAQACAVATHNLGEFKEMEDDFEGARKFYEEARALGKKLGFNEGVKNADKGLKRLKKAEKEREREAKKIMGHVEEDMEFGTELEEP